jgi:hypothetical protein
MRSKKKSLEGIAFEASRQSAARLRAARSKLAAQITPKTAANPTQTPNDNKPPPQKAGLASRPGPSS